MLALMMNFRSLKDRSLDINKINFMIIISDKNSGKVKRAANVMFVGAIIDDRSFKNHVSGIQK